VLVAPASSYTAARLGNVDICSITKFAFLKLDAGVFALFIFASSTPVFGKICEVISVEILWKAVEATA